ncbi:MAG: ABC transporter ATP-binding protein [Sulfolobales archaeon]
MNNDYVLVTKDVTKRFGGLVAVNKVSIAVKKNSITMLMGPNGAGKTTFVNVCTGVYKADEGKVFFNGDDITGLPPYEIYKLGFVRTFQIPIPFQSLTVLENVLAAMKSVGENPLIAVVKGKWIKTEEESVNKAFNILNKIGLSKFWDLPAYKLGAAQLKMLEVARALATGAKLVALDEPIGGVDPAYAGRILSYIKGLKEEFNVSFLLIEHRIDIALPFADYVYVMDKGSVIAEGTPNEVIKNPKIIEIYIGE